MKYKILIILGLFVFRLVFGLFSEFWFTDELQIYLIGLKSYTTGTWPYYGPDLVYTNTQIAGALQGLLVSIPFYFLKIPEAPTIFLNILSFLSLSFLANYITKRIPIVPSWMVWFIVMTTPWTMYYSTRVVNPSYAIVFSIPFFVALIDILPIYQKPILNNKLSFFILGICTTLIMQLHMSWVLLIPLTGLVFLLKLKTNIKQQLGQFLFYMFGLFIGALTLIPTFFVKYEHSATENIVFNIDNWGNLPIITLRFFSFASNEIAYVLGGSTEERLTIVYDQIWMSPAVLVLLIMGFLQVGLYVFQLFNKKVTPEFRKIKILVILVLLLLYASFFFSIKGPSSHTFYILLPLALFYAFHSYDWLIKNFKYALTVLKVMIVAGVLFHIGLGLYNYKNHSLYKDRDKVVNALEQMDYKVLGNRRSDNWGYGY